jgi:hypothetical protein
MESADQRRHLVIHGHFYQPPRENPWTEQIERQEGTAPYHDWNEKITNECYLPNAFSRRLDNWGRITKLINNYEWISFNFGPTLISYIEENFPEVYAKILEADRASAARLGHGNAIAQAYNHVIMPLATRRDQETQIRWGLYDFERRFGRTPEGIWLPETAINDTTLDILIGFGLRFIILSPHQALRVRALDRAPGARGTAAAASVAGAGSKPGSASSQGPGRGPSDGVGRGPDAADASAWRDVSNGSIPTGFAYRCFAPGARGKRDYSRGIDVFFYDAQLSTDVSFNHLLRNGDSFAEAISLGYPRSGSDLVVIATDGEIYGHHEPFADMALSYLVETAPRRGLALTNFASYLADHETRFEVELKPGPNGDGTSWSCFHGVGRWKEDCGDSTGGRPGWNQKWRAPLRAGLNALRESLSSRYAAGTAGLIADPWKARDDYVHVIEERTPEVIGGFLSTHATHALSEEERRRLLGLLESQRNAQLMFTSCGWFFSDISGIETVQVLEYAARAIEFAGSEHWLELEKALLGQLKAAVSNVSGKGTGANIYINAVRGSTMSRPCLCALYAIISHLMGKREPLAVYGNPVEPLEEMLRHVGDDTIKIGALTFTSRYTLGAATYEYLLYIEDEAGFTCFIRERRGDNEYRAMMDTILRFAESGDRAELRDAASELFGKRFTIRHFLAEDRERILHHLSRKRIEAIEERFGEIYAESKILLRLLKEANIPAPPSLVIPAQVHLTKRLVAEVERWERSLDPHGLEGISRIVSEGVQFGIPIDKSSAAVTFTELVLEKTRLVASTLNPDSAAALEQFINMSDDIGIQIDFRDIQNVIHAMLASKVGPMIEELRAARAGAPGKRGAEPPSVAERVRAIESFLSLARRFNFSTDAWDTALGEIESR